jgi:hypothetical protein
VVEHLFSKYKVLNSNPTTTKEGRKEGREGRREKKENEIK